VGSVGTFLFVGLLLGNALAGPSPHATAPIPTSLALPGNAPGALPHPAFVRPATIARPAASVTPVSGATLLATIAFGSVNGTTVVQPAGLSVDTGNGYVYVPDFGSNNVTIIDGATNKVVASPVSGDDPIASVYDPSDGYVYAVDFGTTSDLSVYSGTSYIGSVSIGANPIAAIYDSGNGFVYAMVYGNSSVAVVSGLSVVKMIPVGSYPQAAAIDPASGDLYVANSGSNNVTVISGTTNTIVTNINVGTSPEGIVYDPADGEVYVCNNGASSVTILKGTTIAGTVYVGSGPSFPAYDSANLDVYVPTLGSQTVDVLNGSTVVANVSVGLTPRTATYSPATGEVYITNEGSENISVINGSAVVASISGGNAPWDGVYDPNNRETYVSEYSSGNVSAIGSVPTSYYVTFREHGLPNGTAWGAALGPTEYPTNATAVAMYAVNGSYNYSVPFVPGFAQIPPGTVSVKANDPVVNLTFIRTYVVNFTESGLPSGTLWTVNVSGSTVGGGLTLGDSTPSILFEVINGTYTYQVTPVPGYVTNWTGGFNVSGRDVLTYVNFTPFLYPVDFVESGLAPSVPWSVDFRGTPGGGSGTLIGFSAPNGTFPYTIPPVPGYIGPGGGSTTVAAGPDTVNVPFHPYTFTIDFVETGLPQRTNWSLTVGGANFWTTGTTISVPEPNGSYPYTIATVGRWDPHPPSGTLLVNNASQTFPVRFAPVSSAPVNYSVAFSESGLPSGRAWSIAWNGSAPIASTGSTISLEAPNGTYSYSVGAEPGYRTAWTGSVPVNGAPVAVNVSFGLFRYAVTFVEQGLASGVAWSIALNGSTLSSTGSSLVFQEPNGTFDYTVGYISGYAAVGAGSITVSGASPANTTIAFGPPIAAASGFPVLPVALGLVALALAATAIVLLMRRRARAPPAPPPVESGPAAGGLEPPAPDGVHEL
jgi:YVTN family beta-propeller protein